jgi:CBS domain-containing protein
MTIGEIYDKEPLTVLDTDTWVTAAEKCVATGISDLMVVNADGEFVGVCSEGDLIRACMPDFAEVMQQGMTHEEVFEEFVDKGHENAQKTVSDITVKDPITVSTSTHAQKAAASMLSKNIRRLPVLQNGKLIGTVSRAMVARAVLT